MNEAFECHAEEIHVRSFPVPPGPSEASCVAFHSVLGRLFCWSGWRKKLSIVWFIQEARRTEGGAVGKYVPL